MNGHVKLRRVGVGALACLLLSGCGDGTRTGNDRGAGEPFTLPVGDIEWDVSGAAWFYDGTLHVGDRSVELGDRVDQFVLGATGVYWMSGSTLMFTSAAGDKERIEDVRWGNLAVSADRSVFATVDQSRGPTDEYGTHVLQVAAFDTRTGEQLYRTPDEKPDSGDDLADLYGEIMPLLQGVSDEHLFYDSATIDLTDSSSVPSTIDGYGDEVYADYADTLFPDGYRVGLRGEGDRRTFVKSSMYAQGRLSPDRTVVFDTSMSPALAVAYDADTGRQRLIDAPWEHFALVGWSDGDTFFGAANQIDQSNFDNVVRARQVVTCETSTLACTPVSPVMQTRSADTQGRFPVFLMEGSSYLF